MSDIIEDIEKQYPVETIEAQQIQLWPFLRIYIGSKAVSKVNPIAINRTIVSNLFKNLLFGISNIFKKFNYVIFSDTKERKLIGEVFTDKSMDYIAEVLPQTIIFELPLPAHYPRNKVPTRYITSKYIFYLLEQVYMRLFLRNSPIKNENVIHAILKDYSIEIDYRAIVKKHLAQYYIMKWFLKFHKPKAFFMSCYYTNMGRIKAIKEIGIKVVEIQHGVINRSHFAYNIHKSLDQEFFPNYLFTFGLREKDVFVNSNFFIDPNNVIPVGHLYIDYINETYSGNDSFIKLKSQYKYTVTVSGQNHYTESDLMEFLTHAALLDENILFVFVPRDHTFRKNAYKFSENLVIVNDLNCYELISMSDFHSTVFSTCALEAPSLGVQNILININGLSRLHFGAVLNNSEITRYINTPEEYISTIHSFSKMDKNKIRETNSSIILPGYKNNINKALNQLIA